MTTLYRSSTGERLRPRKEEWIPPKWMYPLIYHKWHILIGAIIALFTLYGFGLGFAEPTETTLPTVLSLMIESIFGGVEDISGWIIIRGNGDYPQLGVFLSGELAGGSEVGSAINSALLAFQSVGVGLVLIFWMIGLFEMFNQANHQLIVEQLIRRFVILAIGITIVGNSDKIVLAMLEISYALAAQFLDLTSGGTSSVDALIASIQENLDSYGSSILPKILPIMGYVFALIIPFIISVIANLGLKIASLKRYLEVCIVYLMSPLMFCDISNSQGGFLHTNALRGMKNVLAITMQSVIIIVGVYAVGIVAGAIAETTLTSENFLDQGLMLGALSLARLGIVAKSSELSRQIVGLT